jgi:hypothetical protein
LKPDSPCIDGGDTTAVIGGIWADLDGNPRVSDNPGSPDTGITLFGLTVDMGAYEYQCSGIAGDVNCDGVVDFRDVAILCWNWASGMDPALSRAITIDASKDNHITSGNVSGVDITLTLPDRLYVDDNAPGDPGPGDPAVSDPLEDGSIQHPFDSIQEAIDDANDGDEIEVFSGTYNEAINFNGRAIRLYSTDGPNSTTINGAGNYHVIQCISGEGPNTNLDGFTITGGNANGSSPHDAGGGMYCESSSPTVTNCRFSGNSAIQGGGMLNANGSEPNVNSCIFISNTSTQIGGGMYNYKSSPRVADCNFSDNSATDNGGGMHNLLSSPTIIECTFIGNSVSTGSGGGMFNFDNSNPEVSDCTFSGNEAGWGGGMCNDNSSPYLNNCLFSDNNSVGGDGGGGMMNFYSTATLVNCMFLNNYATNVGGGMYNVYSSPTITYCTFSENDANNHSGGMSNNWDSNPTLTNCTFSGNSTNGSGGGMGNGENSDPTVRECTFGDNEAGFNGGGMVNNNSNPTVINCTFRANSALGDGGGGMMNYISSATLTNCVFLNNYAVNVGGGMFNVYGSPTVTNCAFSGNSAVTNGGGIFNDWDSYPTVTNCILWGDLPNEIVNNNNSNPTVAYSDVQGGWGGLGNINTDPYFMEAVNPDPNLWNLRLKADSPCIDAGNTTVVPGGILVECAKRSCCESAGQSSLVKG